MSERITYPQKTNNPGDPDSVKLYFATEANQVKAVVNSHADEIEGLATGEGKTYTTLADAVAVSPKPADFTPFIVSQTGDPQNSGYWYFLASSTDGVQFNRPFVDDTPKGEIVFKNDLFNIQTLIEGFTPGLWSNINAGDGIDSGFTSGNSSVTNLLLATPGDYVYFQNLNPDTLGNVNLGRKYAADTGAFIENIETASLIQITPTLWAYQIADAANVNLGVFVNDSNLTSLIIFISSQLLEDGAKIKDSYINFDRTVLREDLLETDSLITGFTLGVWDSANSSNGIVTGSGNDSSADNLIRVEVGQYLYFNNLNFDTLQNVNISRLYNAETGDNIQSVATADLKQIDSTTWGYEVPVAMDVDLGLFFDNSNLDTVSIFVSDGDLYNERKIRSAYIPSGEVNTSNIEAEQLFLRGHSEKTYTAKKYGIISAGQSNADGREALANLPATLDNPLINGMLWDRTSQQFSAGELGVNSGAENNTSSDWAYDWGVFKRLYDYLADTIYIVKRSRGGIPLSANIGETGTGSFNALFETITNEDAWFGADLLERGIRQSNEYAETNVIEIEYKCMIWNQGEADRASIGADRPAAYYTNLKNYIAYERGVLNNRTFKVVVIGIHPDSAGYDPVVREAQVKLADEDPYIYFLNPDSHPWTHIGDNLHYDAAYNELIAEDTFQIIKDF